MWDNKGDFFKLLLAKALVARKYHPPSQYLFIFNNISLLFHLFPEFIVDNNSIYRVNTCNLLLA
jgi:hypothetical protein